MDGPHLVRENTIQNATHHGFAFSSFYVSGFPQAREGWWGRKRYPEGIFILHMAFTTVYHCDGCSGVSE